MKPKIALNENIGFTDTIDFDIPGSVIKIKEIEIFSLRNVDETLWGKELEKLDPVINFTFYFNNGQSPKSSRPLGISSFFAGTFHKENRTIKPDLIFPYFTEDKDYKDLNFSKCKIELDYNNIPGKKPDIAISYEIIPGKNVQFRVNN